MEALKTIRDKPFFCSWSGGKDSCLAFYQALRSGGRSKALLTVLAESGDRSRSHALPLKLLQCQADALRTPLITCATSWADYERTFLSTIRRFTADGIECGVFGDIDLEPHLQWVERVCGSGGIRPYEPLWKRERKELLSEFLSLGFKATIISIKEGVLNADFLGRSLDPETLSALENAGIDASGEKGEYHTVVTGGPIFAFEIPLVIQGAVSQNGYRFLDVTVSGQ